MKSTLPEEGLDPRDSPSELPPSAKVATCRELEDCRGQPPSSAELRPASSRPPLPEASARSNGGAGLKTGGSPGKPCHIEAEFAARDAWLTSEV